MHETREEGPNFSAVAGVVELDSVGQAIELDVSRFHTVKVSAEQMIGTGWDSNAATLTVMRSVSGNAYESAGVTFTDDSGASAKIDVEGDRYVRVEVTTASATSGDTAYVAIFAQSKD